MNLILSNLVFLKKELNFNKYFVDYSVFGFIGVIKKWFESSMEVLPKDMAVIAPQSIFNGLNQSFPLLLFTFPKSKKLQKY